MNIFVGNVDYRVTENQLAELFEEFGEVTTVKIPKDKLNGRSKGYAFVEMANDVEGEEAINNLNGYQINTRAINVSVARPPEERKPRSNNFGGGGGGGNRGGGGGNRDRYDRNF
jgi:RNA recognition motif-containing protein